MDASAARLRRLFLEGFSVTDIAEDLCSFDEDRPAPEVAAFMEGRDFDLIGVRREGRVAGFAMREELSAGRLGDHLRPFGPDDLVPSNASLAETVRSLEINGRCFVPALDNVAMIVTFRDLEKPPVRMWLFGMITVLEMAMTDRLRAEGSGSDWLDLLTAERREAAEVLRVERARRGLPAELLDCLQLGDKTRILLKRPGTAERWGLASNREAKRVVKDLQQLRNNLAHTQPFIASDWRIVAQLAAALEDIITGV